jgi:hypothetical protein
MQAQLSALVTRLAPALERARSAAERARNAARWTYHNVVIPTGRALRRGTLAALGAVESVLLSASGRERIHASAVFALIFMFAITSVDFLLSGAIEFGTPARAQSPSSYVLLERDTTQPASEPADEAEEQAEVPTTRVGAAEASVVAVSYTFSTPIGQNGSVAHQEAAQVDPAQREALAGEGFVGTVADEAPSKAPPSRTKA